MSQLSQLSQSSKRRGQQQQQQTPYRHNHTHTPQYPHLQQQQQPPQQPIYGGGHQQGQYYPDNYPNYQLHSLSQPQQHQQPQPPPYYGGIGAGIGGGMGGEMGGGMGGGGQQFYNQNLSQPSPFQPVNHYHGSVYSFSFGSGGTYDLNLRVDQTQNVQNVRLQQEIVSRRRGRQRAVSGGDGHSVTDDEMF